MEREKKINNIIIHNVYNVQSIYSMYIYNFLEQIKVAALVNIHTIHCIPATFFSIFMQKLLPNNN